MEHRGKLYSVVQGIDTMWKWSVPSLAGHTKSGTAPSRPAGIKLAQQAIDKALGPKKKRLVPPGSGGR
ncbi:MAG: hypothetical protein Q8M31_17895 [Beijerinckiaceae bacterium]|nr:hypothetical protein [Beijerinckiaceae bacterium]